MCCIRIKILFVLLIIVSVIFSLFLIINVHLTSSFQKSDADIVEELQFKKLHTCLRSKGVNKENIIQRSSENSYTELNWQSSKLNGYITPMAYLVPSSVSDIQSAVTCCRQLNIRTVARSGGHSFVKNSFGDSGSLIIDLAKLTKISIDPETMTCEIEPGARSGYINYKLWKYGRFMIPIGDCPSVGVAGFTLGGGYGYFTRHLGLASDNVIEMEMIDARGELLIVNNSTNEDLFWALRGGGGGSFGIITKFKFQMHLAPNYIAHGLYIYEFVDFLDFFYAWQSLIKSDLRKDIGTVVTMERDRIEMEIYKVNLEKMEHVKFDELLNSFSFPTFIDNWFSFPSYTEFLLATASKYTNFAVTEISELENIKNDVLISLTKFKSIYVDKVLEKEDIAKLHILLSDFLKFSKLTIEHNGGAINRFSPEETAFIHRDKNLYHIQITAVRNEGDEMNWEAMENAMKHVYEESKIIFSHRESYQNYLDQEIPDYLERYYGTNLKKLIEVKIRVDPKNMFYHPQSIPVNVKLF